MPTIAIVDGVKIQIFYQDHMPPHFHSVIGDNEVLIAIGNLDVIRGSLPPASMRRVLSWAHRHQARLALNWVRCQADEAPERI